MTVAERAIDQPLEHELDPELQTELQQYPGKWAAITRSVLIAVGDSPLEVLEAARDAGFEEPILHRIPDDSRTAYFF